MPTPFHDAIRRYYSCFRDRDREGLRRLLTRDFHHVGPFGEYRDRDRMLETIWPQVGGSWAEELSIFGVQCRS